MNTRNPSRPGTQLYRWTRDLHLYFGLLASPMILVFALSVIFLNHAFLPWGGTDSETTRMHVTVPRGDNSLEVAKAVRAQMGIAAEIDFIRLDRPQNRLSFPLRRPGWEAQVEVDLATGVATIEAKETGVWDAMVYMHKMPGPHNVAIRGNWFFTRLWGWVSDTTVYLILFLTATGIYLWTVLKAERRIGLIFLGSGAVSFALIILAMVA